MDPSLLTSIVLAAVGLLVLAVLWKVLKFVFKLALVAVVVGACAWALSRLGFIPPLR